jgi:hypothetical protein
MNSKGLTGNKKYDPIHKPVGHSDGKQMETPLYLRKQRGENLLFSFSVLEEKIMFSMFI